ncbi:unnamed protein product, partial [Ectocarpus sp. 8 AP-2014]
LKPLDGRHRKKAVTGRVETGKSEEECAKSTCCKYQSPSKTVHKHVNVYSI